MSEKRKEKRPNMVKRIRNSIRKRKQQVHQPREQAVKVRFDIVNSNLSQAALHLAVLVEHEVNFGKKRIELNQLSHPTWEALTASHMVFTTHKRHIETQFNLTRGLDVHELDAIAKVVYYALKKQ